MAHRRQGMGIDDPSETSDDDSDWSDNDSGPGTRRGEPVARGSSPTTGKKRPLPPTPQKGASLTRGGGALNPAPSVEPAGDSNHIAKVRK